MVAYRLVTYRRHLRHPGILATSPTSWHPGDTSDILVSWRLLRHPGIPATPPTSRLPGGIWHFGFICSTMRAWTSFSSSSPPSGKAGCSNWAAPIASHANTVGSYRLWTVTLRPAKSARSSRAGIRSDASSTGVSPMVLPPTAYSKASRPSISTSVQPPFPADTPALYTIRLPKRGSRDRRSLTSTAHPMPILARGATTSGTMRGAKPSARSVPARAER